MDCTIMNFANCKHIILTENHTCIHILIDRSVSYLIKTNSRAHTGIPTKG